MAWESRPRTDKRYYTRTYRVNGRRVRVYLGAGPIGELARAIDLDRRIAAELARRDRLAARTA